MTKAVDQGSHGRKTEAYASQCWIELTKPKFYPVFYIYQIKAFKDLGGRLWTMVMRYI